MKNNFLTLILLDFEYFFFVLTGNKLENLKHVPEQYSSLLVHVPFLHTHLPILIEL